jgi:hypothetical protein
MSNIEVLTLSSLIGKEILEARCHYTYENEWGLTEYHTYIKLSGNIVIDIPMFDDQEYSLSTQDNSGYLQERFDSGNSFLDETRKKIEGQMIVDFFLCFNEEGDLHDLGSGYILLSDGNYLVERQYAPPGIGIGLLILDEKRFIDRNKQFKIDARSFLQTR